MTIRVVIADDHAFYREGICTLLDGRDGIAVVGEAGNGREALAAIEAHQPDIALLDIRMPLVDGIEVCRQIRRNHPAVGVVIVTMFDDDDTLIDALSAGAHGYVLKDASRDDVIRAIHAAHARQSVFSPTIADKLVELLADRRQRALPAGLTAREAEVLSLMAQGLRNDQIADRLAISPKTVRNHLSLAYTKIAVLDRVAAANWTHEHLRQGPRRDH